MRHAHFERAARWAAVALFGALCACGPSSDAELARHLRLELRGGSEAMYPQRVSFAVKRTAAGRSIFLGDRDAVFRANGIIIPTPHGGCSACARERLAGGSSDESYYHLSAAEVLQWLGGPGSWRLTASLGPVTSNELLVHISDGGAVRCEPSWKRE